MVIQYVLTEDQDKTVVILKKFYKENKKTNEKKLVRTEIIDDQYDVEDFLSFPISDVKYHVTQKKNNVFESKLVIFYENNKVLVANDIKRFKNEGLIDYFRESGITKIQKCEEKKAKKRFALKRLTKTAALSLSTLAIVGMFSFFEGEAANVELSGLSSVPVESSIVSEESVESLIENVSTLENEDSQSYSFEFYTKFNELNANLNSLNKESITLEAFVAMADMYLINPEILIDKITTDEMIGTMSKYNKTSVGVLRAIDDYYYAELEPVTAPIISDYTKEEREQRLVNVAISIFEIDDTERLAAFIGTFRIETGNGTDSLCVEQNNPGGIQDGARSTDDVRVFRTFPTWEAGIARKLEIFERLETQMKSETGYKYWADNKENTYFYEHDKSYLENINFAYCETEEWHLRVGECANEAIRDGDVARYKENYVDLTNNKTI